jgi:hypothetical protein
VGVRVGVTIVAVTSPMRSSVHTPEPEGVSTWTYAICTSLRFLKKCPQLVWTCDPAGGKVADPFSTSEPLA